MGPANPHEKRTGTPPATTEPIPPALAASPDYEVIREISRGGMGVVYLARNRRMDRLEGLKVVNSALLAKAGALERFEREMRSAARLNHPNIVIAYSSPPLEGLLAFAMEYVDGTDLYHLVKSAGPLPVSNACYYIYQAAQGLQHAHDRNMVHRDIKPNNLMLTRDGKKQVLKILDFGLAKATSENPIEGGLTREGQMLGTPHYVAPEQSLNAAKADIRADIYSLGCTLYYLLTGHPPFKDKESLFEILTAHHAATAPLVSAVRPDVPAELAAIVAKMMAKDAAQRYQQPSEVAQVLAPFFKAGVKSLPALKGVGSGSSVASPAAEVAASETLSPKVGETSKVPVPAKAVLNAPAVSPAPQAPVAGPQAAAESDAGKQFQTMLGLRTDSKPPTAARPGYELKPASMARKPAAIWTVAAAVLVLAMGLLLAWTGGAFKSKSPEERETADAGSKIGIDAVRTRKTADDDSISPPDDQQTSNLAQTTVEQFGPATDVGGSGMSTAFADGLSPAAIQASTKAFFNVKDLTGWDGLPGGYWRVRDGAIVGAPSDGVKAHTFLCSRQAYRDFDLKFKVRRKNGVGNSGVQFRSKVEDAKRYTVSGPQVEIDSLNHKFPPGSIVAEGAGPSFPADRARVAAVWKDKDFNEMHIRCVGNHVTVRVNGVIARDLVHPAIAGEGIIAWQLHGYKSPEEVTFKDIEFVDLTRTAKSGTPATDLVAYKDKLFRLFANGRSWHESKSRCEDMGGRLVQVRSREENEFVTKLAKDANLDGVWIGGTDQANEGQWKWVDGSPLTYTNWSRVGNQPNNKNGVEHYLMIMIALDTGQWCDQPDTSVEWKNVGYICEWDAGRIDSEAPDTIAEVKSREATSATNATGMLPSKGTDAGFVSLFNGRDLAGWEQHDSQKGQWYVDGQGLLTGTGTGLSHLYTKRSDFSDFHLRVEASINAAGNSGVWFRTSFGPRWPPNRPEHPTGYEANLAVSHARGGATGSLYIVDLPTKPGGPVVPVTEPLTAPDRWFTLEIIADGKHIVIKVDGRTTADFVDTERHFSAGRIALEQLDSKTIVRFHKIEIKTGKPDATAMLASPSRSPAPASADPPVDSKPLDPMARARSIHEVALKKADEALGARFNREIDALRRSQMKSDERLKLIEAVKLEKATFESRKTIPWSAPMRPAVLDYLRDVKAADDALNKEYERSISARLKVKDDTKAEQLKNELARVFPARLMGAWVEDKFVLRFYSDGTWMILNTQGKPADAKRVWSLNAKELIIKSALNSDPTKVTTDRGSIAADGQTMSLLLQQNGNRLTLRVER